MNRIYAALILLCIIVSGCGEPGIQSNVERDGGTKAVLVWYYDHQPVTGYNELVESAIDFMKTKAIEMGIEVKVTKYGSDSMSYDDYVLKRNVAIANKEADIIFDRITEMYRLAGKNGDYSRMKTYENLCDTYKGQYMIPVMITMSSEAMYKSLPASYGMEVGNSIISLEDYYDIKQDMKSDGAKFVLNEWELEQLVDYYVEMSGVKFNNTAGDYHFDMEAVKETIINVYNDLSSHYDKVDNLGNENSIKDSQTGEVLVEGKEYTECSMYSIILMKELDKQKRGLTESDYCYIYDGNVAKDARFIPGLFISEGAGDCAYELSSVLFDDGFYDSIYEGTYYAPVIDTAKVRERWYLNEDWSYNGQDIGMNDRATAIDLYDKTFAELKEGDMSSLFENIKAKTMMYEFIGSQAMKIWNDTDQLNMLDGEISKFETNLRVWFD